MRADPATQQRQALERRSTRNHHSESKPPVTPEKLRELRAEGIAWMDIAQRYGRSVSGLQDIMHGGKKVRRG